MIDEPFVRLGSLFRWIAATLAFFIAAAPSSGQNVTSKVLPVVWVTSTGGTIAGRGASPTDLSDYKIGSILGEELLDSVPEIKGIATIKVEQMANVASGNITLNNWLTLANRINTILGDDPKVAGVVVTHGTDANLIAFAILLALRLRAEERMMAEACGEEYVAYAARTKRLIPGVW